ncbi:MAG: LuxR C-terminal-related transcriptional regulator [Panacagrimonas sp.]
MTPSRYASASTADAQRVLLSRERVLAFDQGLPVLVVEAPSGYGKSVLAEMWLDRHRADRLCAWVTLDVTCRDPMVFIERVLEAIGAEYPSQFDSSLDDESARAERFDYLVTRLHEVPGGIHLVVDDTHVLHGAPSRVYLEKLLQIASSKLRICLTQQPVKMLDIGLGRLAAQSLASWIPLDSLPLTREEVAAFAVLRGQNWSEAQIDWLWRATDGWPAFVQLAMAIPRSDLTRLPVADSGAMREYIYDRFLEGLTPDERDVLWILACVGSPPTALLQALDPAPAKVDLALQRFRQLGIVQNLDLDDRSVVRLHALIGEAAFTLLDRGALRARDTLIREAAEWYWRHGLGPDAVRLALQSGPEMVAQARDWLTDMSTTLVFRSGLHQTLLDLVELWEQATGQTDVGVDEAAGWALIFQRKFDLALPRIDRVEAAPDEATRNVALLQKAVLSALRDDYVESRALSDAWIKKHPGNRSFQMGIASTVHAFSQKCFGEVGIAQASLREALYCFNASQYAYGIGWAHIIGALVQIQSGRYRAALAQVESGLARCPSSQGFGSLRCMLRALEGFLRYERDDLVSARDTLIEVVTLLPDQGIVDAMALGYATAARLRAANGDFGTALDILAEGEELGVQREYPRLTFILRAERALLLVRNGSSKQARTVLNSIPPHRALRTSVQRLQARMHILDGDPKAALEILALLQVRAREMGRYNRLAEALALTAEAEDLLGNEPAAMAAIGEALEIGAAEGYVRSFLEEGQFIRSLVERCLQRDGLLGLGSKTLATRILDHAAAPSKPQPAPVPAPAQQTLQNLNKRERQILQLIDQGLSNAQVGTRCFLSAGTVKWYLQNLYEKFAVNNRTALLRAVREQGMQL